MAAEQPSDAASLSDTLEVIQADEMSAGGSGSGEHLDNRRPKPYVVITEQPAPKALRFRYECEGRSAGSIPGVNSTHENKTYPSIKIENYDGRSVVVVSCVTKEHPYKPHPHNLVGKEGCGKGVCTVTMTTNKMTFPNLGIQCVKKKDIEGALEYRKSLNIDPFQTGIAHKNQPSNIDLNCVRLCFQVFLEGPKKDEYRVPLKPVVSDPIYDKKAMSDLTICKLSHCSDSVIGGKEIILLCEKVAKEDISVRFYEERNNELYWEAQGDFQPVNVHKQVAICFRTPKYKNINIEHPVDVMLQLRRPSDGAVSESVPFKYMPLDSDPAELKRKRQKYDGESSPQNILRPPQDDDSRSAFAMSSDVGYHMHQVKREPSEHSPINYNYAGSVSPIYRGKSPESPSSHNTSSPVPQISYPNINLFKFNSGGELLEGKSRIGNHPFIQDVPYAESGTSKQTAGIGNHPFKQDVSYAESGTSKQTAGIGNHPFKQDVSYAEPGTSKQTVGASSISYMFPYNYVGNDLNEGGSCVQANLVQHGMNPGILGSTNIGTGNPHGLLPENGNDTNRSQFPVESSNTYMNMDSQQLSSDLNASNLDTGELDKMVMMTDANLSDNLSTYLTLDDKPLKSPEACDQSTTTDSFTRVAENMIQELVEFSGMNQTPQQ